jgi:prepilin-type N-terminal cleavage/methylation domain-containing protein
MLRHRRAFTLTEAVIVLVVMGVLAGIGSLTYSAFFTTATDRAAVARLDVAYATELRFAATWGLFSAHPPDLPEGAGVELVAGPAEAGQVSIAVGRSGALALSTVVSDGCIARRYPPLGEGSGTVELALPAPCDATAALAEGDDPRDPTLSARW